MASTSRRPRTHRSPYNGQRYTLYRCTSCDLQFWWPLRADPSIYEHEGFAAYEGYHAGTRPFPRWAEPLFHRLPVAHGRALDIGCGDGSVLQRLQQMGWEPSGIDLDKKSIDAAKRRYGLHSIQAVTLDEFVRVRRLDSAGFNLVTFFEVLEHQDNPLGFLKSVCELLAPNAVVAGSVPNRDRFLVCVDRRLGPGDLPPHHFLWFSPRCLSHLLARLQFSDTVVIRVGALPFVELVRKLTRLVRGKLSRLPKALDQVAFVLIAPGIPFAAAFAWAGMRLRPPQLYFQSIYRGHTS